MANITNILVKESITEALLFLMEKKDYSEISITELTKKAGVGRVSFYRNYESKEDILLQYMDGIASDHWNNRSGNDTADLWKTTFEIFELLKPTVLLIHKSNADYILYRFIRNITKKEHPDSVSIGYWTAMIGGMIFGLYDQWINTGMKESPEELAVLFNSIEFGKK